MWISCSKHGIPIRYYKVLNNLFRSIFFYRRRIQVMDKHTGIIYISSLDCIRKMATKEGMLSFYKGFGIHCAKTLLGSSLQAIFFHLINSGNLIANKKKI